MILGPHNFKRPPCTIPSTGSTLKSIKGKIIPTLPGTDANGQLSDMTGDASVAP